ncbi:MAG TPA: DegV family protein, partial [Jiangellaceae bacterium]|nr:DegV family protein [Jiangellaceae bacterium]
MSRTVVVTDSTAILPAIEVEGRSVQDVDVVALDVVIDGQSHRDGIDITPRQLAAALRAKATVSTSRPSSAALLGVYRRLTEEGADGIVS